MAVKIRLARGGAKKKPYYRIVVANATAPRDGDFLEKVGTYNPLLAKGAGDRITLKAERVTYWLSKGATPTETVARFIAASGIPLPEFVTSKMAIKSKVRNANAQKKAALEQEAKDAEAKAAAEAALVAEKAEAEKAAAEAEKAAEAAAAAEEVAAAEAPVSEDAPEAQAAAEAVAEDSEETKAAE